jgi:microcystin-dependent protein
MLQASAKNDSCGEPDPLSSQRLQSSSEVLRMSNNFVGEVRLVGFNFAPYGWNICNGQLLPISEYSTLYNLIGTTYGGDGVQTFGIPNLQGRVTVHQGTLAGGSNYVMGEQAGVENVTITSNTYPSHTHPFICSSNSASLAIPSGNTVGNEIKIYETGTPTTAMSASMIGLSQGSSLPHSNVQPFVALNWVIAFFGIYPTQS